LPRALEPMAHLAADSSRGDVLSRGSLGRRDPGVGLVKRRAKREVIAARLPRTDQEPDRRVCRVDATGAPIAKARAGPHQEHFDLHPGIRAWIRSTGLSRLRAGLWGSHHSLAVASVGPLSTMEVV
jgi:hypothetical protein